MHYVHLEATRGFDTMQNDRIDPLFSSGNSQFGRARLEFFYIPVKNESHYNSGITPPLKSFFASSIDRSALGRMMSDLIISFEFTCLPFLITISLSSASFFLNSKSSERSVRTSSTISLSMSLSFLSVRASTEN